jgi:hypothetical protein
MESRSTIRLLSAIAAVWTEAARVEGVHRRAEYGQVRGYASTYNHIIVARILYYVCLACGNHELAGEVREGAVHSAEKPTMLVVLRFCRGSSGQAECALGSPFQSLRKRS